MAAKFDSPYYDPTHPPIIFLDVDGVLAQHLDFLEPDLVLHLARAVKNTGSEIVVTSTWRLGQRELELLTKTLEAYEIKVVGRTPSFDGKPDPRYIDPEFGGDWRRVLEIRSWIHTNRPYVFPWVAVDDDVLSLPPERFIRTFGHTGITSSKADEIIEKINKIANDLPKITTS